MKSYIPWILFAVFLFLWIWAVKGCHDGGKETATLQDSLKVYRSVTAQSIKKSDSIVRYSDSVFKKKTIDSIKFAAKVDSQAHVIAILTGRFTKTKDSIITLYKDLKTFYLSHDTVALIDAYNRLYQAFNDANTQLFAIQIARDSADNIRDAEIARLNRLVNTTQGLLNEFKDAFAAEVKNSQGLANELEKSIRQKKKANLWGIIQKIGIGIGGILIGKLL